MAKTKEENPYEEEQAMLDLNKVNLESMDEQKLKELRDKFNDAYSEARRDRLETQKEFVRAYKNLGDYRILLMSNVKSGKTAPLVAISLLRDFVNSKDLTAPRKEDSENWFLFLFFYYIYFLYGK